MMRFFFFCVIGMTTCILLAQSQPKSVPKTPNGPKQKPFTIGAAGWFPSKITPADLGKRIDKSLQSLNRAKIEMLFLVNDTSGEGSVWLQGDVQDPSHYMIQYSLPKSDAMISQFVADGKRRGVYENANWTIKESLSTVRKNPAGALLAEAWPTTFPKYALLPATGPWSVWGPLLSAWKSGAAGYKLRIEERQMETMGKKKPYYRIIATRQSPVLTQIECVIDGTRFVPLTLRANLFPKGKRAAKYQWNGGWKFDQKMNSALFKVP